MDRAAKRKLGRQVRSGGRAAWAGTTETLERRMLLSAATDSVDLLSGSPAVFVQNKGQWSDASIRYALQSSGANVLMTDKGPIFQIFKDSSAEQFFAAFDGANTVRPSGSGKSSATFNYYVGDNSTWRTNVPGYQQINYSQLYDGIDLKTWGKSSSLKYEFHVAAGADYSQIQVSYDGIKSLSIDSDGRLHVKTRLGELVDDAPVVYQVKDGKQVVVESAFKLIDKDTYTFEVKGTYDHNRELVIDPDLDWSTFLGGQGADVANSVATDGANNTYVTGRTASADFAVTANGIDTTFGANAVSDAFVTKYGPGGTLLYSTYYGGAAEDVGTSIVLDDDIVYVAGYTASSDLAVTGGFDTTFGGAAPNNYDAFVLKLTNAGVFTWGSYLGGTQSDRAFAIDVDGTGNVYVTGDTASSDFTTTAGTDTTFGGGTDAFLTRINNTAIPVIGWSTFVGGEGVDVGNAVTLATPAVSIVGTTTSVTGLATPTGLDSTFNGGSDAFIATLDTANGTITRATYYGGIGLDEGKTADYDGTGQLWVGGGAGSLDFPVGAGFDPTYGGAGDGFIATFTNAGVQLFSSFVGGSGADIVNGLSIDGLNNVVVVGSTGSTDLAVVLPFPTGFGGGGSDAFILSVTPLYVVNYLGYIGGSGSDAALSVDIDSTNAPILVGQTSSTNFPANGIDGIFGGGGTDAFVTRVVETFGSFAPAAPTDLKATVINLTQIDLTWTDNADNELGYEVSRRLPNGEFEVIATLPRNSKKYSDKNLSPSTTYIYKVRAFNAGGGADSNEVTATTKTAGLHGPTGLATTPVSATRIDLKWRDNSDNETNFEVFRALESDGIFSKVATLPAGTTTYRDQTGLAPGTTYLYRVRAVNAFRTSKFSEQVPGTTKDANFVAAPTGLSVNHTSDTTNVLSWTDNADNETSFSIERTLAGEDNFLEIGTSGPNVSTFTDEDAAPGEIYFYRVRALSGANVSEYSNIAASDLETALAAPSFVEALAVSWDQIKLTWIDNALIETGIVIERAINKPNDWKELTTVDPDSTVFYDKHVQSGRRYYYRLRATDGSNFSVYSNQATDRVLPEFLTAPRAPSGLKLRLVDGGNVRLGWKDNTQIETGFLIERSTEQFGPFTRLKQVDADVTRFIDRSTNSGVHYYYRVRTVDSLTRSAPTEAADITTPAPVKLGLTVLESPGKEDGTTIKFLIRRKDLEGHDFFGGDLPVNYAISGSATNGVDYDTLTGTIVIPDGEASVQLIVSPFDDSLAEGNETVTVELTSGRRYKISPNNRIQTGEIEDDDNTIQSVAKVSNAFAKKSITSAIDLVDLV